MFEDTKRYHRQPVAFGPAATPRQDPSGQPFTTWETESEQHLSGLVFEAERSSLQALLPDGYELDPSKEPTVLVEIMNLRKLPWLAGRGYNTFGIYANDVICKRSSPPITASYQIVLFESLFDPIMTGREELGAQKLWAEIPDAKVDNNGTLVHTLSWLGFEFGRLEIPDLCEKPVGDAPVLHPRAFTTPGKEGMLLHRYVPAVGMPGQHDANYAVHLPGGGDKKPKVLRHRGTGGPANNCKVTFTAGSFQELPTLWMVSQKLSELRLGDVKEVQVAELLGASDAGKVRRIEF
ncbi:hypothetical protein T439DRAFT_353065 [Meredithblackwellia eburnea MCA 4105]